MKVLSLRVVLSVISMLALWGLGCEKVNPVDPSEAVFTQSIQIIKLPGPRALNKIIPVSQLISADSGGVVTLYYDNGQELNHFTIDIRLEFLPHAVDNDVVVNMGLDDSLLVLYLEPSMTFNIPALLQVNATGLDLSGFALATEFSLFWHDLTNDTWIEMSAENIEVTDLTTGTLQCINGQIPHFSIYAFGR